MFQILHHLQHEILGPRNIQDYGKLGSEKTNTDGYTIFLMGYASSPFRDFESYPKIVVGLDEEDIQWILKHNTSISGTFEIVPSIYSIKDFSEAVSTMGHHEGTLQIK